MAIMLKCRQCGFEFPISEDKYESERRILVSQINSINQRISDLKANTPEYLKKSDKYIEKKTRLANEASELHKRLSDIKSFIKQVGNQKQHEEYELVKELLRERMPSDEYHQLFADVRQMMEAEKIGELMKHDYSHSNWAGGTNINKI